MTVVKWICEPMLLLFLLVLGISPAIAGWEPLASNRGIYRYSNTGNYILSILCGNQTTVLLSLRKGNVLGTVVESVKIDGRPVLGGTGMNLGLLFEPHLKPDLHFRLDDPPLDLIKLLKKGLMFEAKILDRDVLFDLRGFTSTYDATCGKQDPIQSHATRDDGGILSTPVSSGWRIRFEHDCEGGQFVFAPTDIRAKWDMGTEKVDGKILPFVDPTKIIFDGDMVGPIRIPYREDWFAALRNGKTLAVEITDYSSVGGPKKSVVRFDLEGFCR